MLSCGAGSRTSVLASLDSVSSLEMQGPGDRATARMQQLVLGSSCYACVLNACFGALRDNDHHAVDGLLAPTVFLSPLPVTTSAWKM